MGSGNLGHFGDLFVLRNRQNRATRKTVMRKLIVKATKREISGKRSTSYQLVWLARPRLFELIAYMIVMGNHRFRDIVNPRRVASKLSFSTCWWESTCGRRTRASR